MEQFLHRNAYIGDIRAYGGGNSHDIDTVKAGPGTIYLLEGQLPRLVHTLKISGDVDSSVQKQSYVYINGTSGEFQYNLLTLTGLCFCVIANMFARDSYGF